MGLSSLTHLIRLSPPGDLAVLVGAAAPLTGHPDADLISAVAGLCAAGFYYQAAYGYEAAKDHLARHGRGEGLSDWHPLVGLPFWSLYGASFAYGEAAATPAAHGLSVISGAEPLPEPAGATGQPFRHAP